MNDTLAAAWLGVGGTLVGAIIGAMLTTRVAYHLALRESFVKFAFAFSEELIVLKTSISTDEGFVHDLLEGAYQKHLRAYLEVRTVLRGCHRKTLEREWKTYAQEKEEDIPQEKEQRRFVQYLPDSHEDMEAKKKLAIRHIESLLDFDKYTCVAKLWRNTWQLIRTLQRSDGASFFS